MRRFHPFVFLVVTAVTIGGASQPVRAQAIYTPPTGGRNFAGVWLIQGDHSTIRTVDGKLPPMNQSRCRPDMPRRSRPAGLENRTSDTIQTCKPHGFPRILFAAYPVEILQEPTQVTFIHEIHHMPRMVYLDMTLPKPDDLDPNWMGLSVGRWEGDTLVIESEGFNDLTTVDAAGLPHSTEMRVSERLRKLDGDTLEDVVTVTDPKNLYEGLEDACDLPAPARPAVEGIRLHGLQPRGRGGSQMIVALSKVTRQRKRCSFVELVPAASPANRYTKADCLRAFGDSEWFHRLDARSRYIAQTVLTRDNGMESRRLAVGSLRDVFAIDPDTLTSRFLAPRPTACLRGRRQSVAPCRCRPPKH